jgi:hypothetical protein
VRSGGHSTRGSHLAMLVVTHLKAPGTSPAAPLQRMVKGTWIATTTIITITTGSYTLYAFFDCDKTKGLTLVLRIRMCCYKYSCCTPLTNFFIPVKIHGDYMIKRKKENFFLGDN